MISYSSDRARESFDPPETALRGRRPGDPGRTERYYVSLNLFGPILCPRTYFFEFITWCWRLMLSI